MYNNDDGDKVGTPAVIRGVITQVCITMMMVIKLEHPQ